MMPVMMPIASRQVRITVVAAMTIKGCVLKLVSDMRISFYWRSKQEQK